MIIDYNCFNATFNNISMIEYLPVLLLDETGVPGENVSIKLHVCVVSSQDLGPGWLNELGRWI